MKAVGAVEYLCLTCGVQGLGNAPRGEADDEGTASGKRDGQNVLRCPRCGSRVLTVAIRPGRLVLATGMN
ncbi:MAG: hypothetical protein ACYC9Q_04650 [Bacillota bacterium]